MTFWRKLRCLLPSYRAAQEREMQEELESLKAMAGKNELGNLTLVAENAREVWRWSGLETVWQDIRYSLRTLRKTPGFTITAVIVLGIGIGLNLAFFQFLNVVALKTLAVRDPVSLVHVTFPAGENQLNYSAMQFLRSSNIVFSAVLMDMRVDARTRENGYKESLDHRLEWNGEAKAVGAHYVSANWFDELGTKALRGRLFSESADGGPNALPVAVISERLWETYLLKDPDVVGSAVRLTPESGPVMIVGIVPRTPGGLLGGGQDLLNPPDIWIPVTEIPDLFPDINLSTSASVSGRLYGRLKPGISIRAATEALRPLLDEVARQQPRYRGIKSVALFSGSTNFRQPQNTLQILALVGGIGSFSVLILLISCSNLANLVLSRTISRIQELSVRVSLGASRARILRHLLTETALVALLASGIGLLIADVGMRVMAAVYPEFLALDLSLDWRTIVMAMAGTIVMTAFVGLLPASTIGKRDLGLAMKDGGEQASSSLSRVRQRQFLLAVQVTGSCLLLILTGFMLRTLQRALTPPGYDAGNVLVLRNQELKDDAANLYFRNLREYMAQQPGIETAALSENWPSHSVYTGRVSALPGLRFEAARVEPDFFRILRIPFLAGEPFAASAAENESVVVSKSLALQAFGTVDAVGKVFPILGRVTGVVDDVRLADPERVDHPDAYLPLKVPDRFTLLARTRTSADAARLLFTLPKSLRQLDSRVPEVYLLERNVKNGVEEMQLAGAGLSALAILALAIACMGIYGVVSYGVAVRRKEIGIRLALGALNRSIVILMIRQLIWPVSLAVVVGLIGGVALGLAGASDRMFFPPEASVVVAALLVLLVMIGLACIVPTLRALRSSNARVLS